VDGNSHKVFLRTAINSDFESIMNIDLKSFDPPWEPKKFEAYRESTRVLIIKDRVVGFWVATLEVPIEEHEYINLLRLAVTPSFRRIGIGAVLMEDLLVNYNRLICATVLTDIQVTGQFFLKSQGFKHIKTLRKIDIPGIGEVTTYYFKKESDA